MEGIARVLCAVDTGEPGLAAFEQALALARVHDAKLIVVYAVPRSQSFNTGATERVAYLLNLRAAAEAAGVDVRVDVQHGEAAGIISLHARARQPDLIVLSTAHGNGANGLRVGAVLVIVGTQSRNRLGRWMFGVTGQLLQEAPCPVLAVPTRTPHVGERNEWRPAA